MRFPGQWFQLEAGLAYNWHRHYDSTTGRYTQADPLGLNQGPQAPSLTTNPLLNAAPGVTIAAANDNAVSLGILDSSSAQGSKLLSGLGSLSDSRQDGLGLATQTEYISKAGARGRASRVTHDGTSFYGYVRQSPIMRTDPKGLAVGSISPLHPKDLSEKCLAEDEASARKGCHDECADKYVGRGYNSDAPLRYWCCLRECMKGKGYNLY